ncbi:MAG: SDR family NAD(P)-dependent oxidoreductase [Gammaproteobacteria bacterium]
MPVKREGGPLAQRVALVTGAGRGLGRSHALMLARQGARVLVNDPGGAVTGEGGDATVARAVAEEIRAAGGEAVADGSDIGSFAGAARAVQAALDAFGAIDIVVNNAGIVAPGADRIGGLDDAVLRRLLDVHLFGTLGTIQAAWPHLCRRRWGRIVNTVSEAALPIPRGQGDPDGGGISYAAAKAAVWSATLNIARAGAAHGITCNAISPGALTRMSAAHLAGAPPGALDLDPVHVSRVVCALAAEDAGDITGRVIHAAAGRVREYLVDRRADSEIARRLAPH